MKRMLITWLLAALLSAGIACAAQSRHRDRQDMASQNAWRSELTQRLIDAGSADALFTAAWMKPLPEALFEPEHVDSQQPVARLDTDARWALLDRAAMLAPDNATFAAASLRACAVRDHCDVDAHARRLHQAAPEDGSYLMPALHRALRDGNSRNTTRILRRMAEARTLEYRYGDAMKVIDQALRSLGPLPQPAQTSGIMQAMREAGCLDVQDCLQLGAFSAASAMYLGVSMPGFGDLNRACKPDHPAWPLRQSACRRIGIALARSGTIISHMMGLALWQRSALDDDDLAAATRALRRVRWISEKHVNLLLSKTISDHDVQQAMLENGSEMAAMRAMLKEHDIPLTPPEGWHSRSQQFEQHASVQH